MRSPHQYVLLCSLLMGCVLLTGSAEASNSNDAALRSADSLRTATAYDSAVVLYTEVISTCESGTCSDSLMIAALVGRGETYFIDGYYRECFRDYAKAHERVLSTSGPSSRAYARSLYRMADINEDMGHFDSAQVLLEKSEQLFMRLDGGTSYERIPILIERSRLLNQLEQDEDARLVSLEAQTLWERSDKPDTADLIKALIQRAYSDRFMAEYEAADSLCDTILSLAESQFGRESRLYLEAMYIESSILDEQRRFEESGKLIDEYLSLAPKVYREDHPQLGPILNQKAHWYSVNNAFDKAEPLLLRVKHMYEQGYGPNHVYVGISYNELGRSYVSMGRLEDAQTCFEKSLDIARSNNRPAETTLTTRSNLALVYLLQNKMALATSMLEETCDMFASKYEPTHPSILTARTHLAYAYAEQYRYEEAEKLYREVVGDLETKYGPDDPNLEEVLVLLGMNYFSRQMLDQASITFNRAVAIQKSYLPPQSPVIAGTTSFLAAIEAANKNYDSSLALFRQVLEVRYGFLSGVYAYTSEEQKAAYIYDSPILMSPLYPMVMRADTDESRRFALTMLLRGKAFVIDAMAKEKEYAFCSENDEVRELLDLHGTLCNEISTRAIYGQSELAHDSLDKEIATLKRTKDSVESIISQACQGFRDDLVYRKATAESVAAALKENEVLLEYAAYETYNFDSAALAGDRYGPEHYLAFAVTSDTVIVLHDLADRATLDSLINQLRVTIDEAGPHIYSPRAAEYEEHARVLGARLYDLVLAPFADVIKDKTALVISPDAALNLLPFGVLPSGDGYLIEDYEITYLSTGRDLIRTTDSSRDRTQVQIIADPDYSLSRRDLMAQSGGSDPTLASAGPEMFRATTDCLSEPFAPLRFGRAECEGIARIFRSHGIDDVSVHLGSDASETMLKDMSSAPWVLHITTHGFSCSAEQRQGFDFDNSLLRTGLALAGANALFDNASVKLNDRDDGILTAFEVSGLSLLGTRLVTLSACESGLGQAVSGEGVYGLRRAFQHAGARSVLMSLWRVPDQETYALMSEFYDCWLNGASMSESIRHAQLAILRKVRDTRGTGHPLLWGGFILVGGNE